MQYGNLLAQMGRVGGLLLNRELINHDESDSPRGRIEQETHLLQDALQISMPLSTSLSSESPDIARHSLQSLAWTSGC